MEKILPVKKNLGGFEVKRIIPNNVKSIGPWVFFDHFGPAEFAPGVGIDVRPHPHINLATVTFLFDGNILHRDSLRSTQIIKPGDVNLMVAGKGITHSERETLETQSNYRMQHGLQLWHALPDQFEEIKPEFHHYNTNNIPKFDKDGFKCELIIGQIFGKNSPVKTFSENLFMIVEGNKNSHLTIPKISELGIYVLEGQILIESNEKAKFENTEINQHEMYKIKNHELIVKPNIDSKFVVIGGKNLGKRYLFWNFISSRQERIKEACIQWEKQNFPKIPGDDKEYIPLPENIHIQ